MSGSMSMLSGPVVRTSLAGAVRKLDPRELLRNPVILAVEVVALLVTGQFVADIVSGGGDLVFTGQVVVWLWLTVLFANFAEALAEGRGKAQAAALRATRTTTMARALRPGGVEEQVPAPDLRAGDVVVCEAGDVIPATARSSRASPRSTSRRSPASPRR